MRVHGEPITLPDYQRRVTAHQWKALLKNLDARPLSDGARRLAANCEPKLAFAPIKVILAAAPAVANLVGTPAEDELRQALRDICQCAKLKLLID